MVSNAGHHSQVQCRLFVKYSEDLANQITATTMSTYLVDIQATASPSLTEFLPWLLILWDKIQTHLKELFLCSWAQLLSDSTEFKSSPHPPTLDALAETLAEQKNVVINSYFIASSSYIW